MIQLKAYTDIVKSDQYWLDLYEEDPIKLNFSIEDITNTAAKSIFSRTFRVPGTDNNNRYFKYAFEVGVTDFDVTVKKPAELLVNGAEFRQGHIRLQKIYRNEKKDRYDYELLFLGETRDFSSALGTSSLCTLDLSHLAHGFTDANVELSWSAYPSTRNAAGATITPSFSNGLPLYEPDGVTQTYGDVIYPLVDFGNDGDVDNSNPRIAVGVDHDFSNNRLPLERLKPMIRAKALVDAIFYNTEYSYEAGGFFDSDLFKQIYVSGWGDVASAELNLAASDNIFEAAGNQDQGYDEPLDAPVEITDPNNNYDNTTSIYQVPQDASLAGDYRFYAEIEYLSRPLYSGGSGNSARVLLQKSINGGAWTTFGTGNYASNAISDVDATVTVTVSEITTGSGVRIRGYIEGDGDPAEDERTRNQKFECLVAPGQSNMAAQFDCDYKQIDFIKDLLTTFRLVMAPRKDNPTVFIIEPWAEYVGTGEIYDWTQKLDRSKDVILEPLFDTQTDEIFFKHTEDQDHINKYHFEAYKYEYGRLEFDSANELLTGSRDVMTKWAPTPIAQIEGAANTNSFIIPQVHTHDGSGNHVPIKPKTRLVFYNGMQSTDSYTWRLANTTNTGQAPNSPYSYYPLISNSSAWPMQQGATVLNWFNDIGYWGNNVSGFPTQLGQGLYNTYWLDYIQSLYNKDARRLTGTFILNDLDLTDFSFDDMIFLDGHYWRPEKVIDAPIGEDNQVRVQLIKILDFVPRGTRELLDSYVEYRSEVANPVDPTP